MPLIIYLKTMVNAAAALINPVRENCEQKLGWSTYTRNGDPEQAAGLPADGAALRPIAEKNNF